MLSTLAASSSAAPGFLAGVVARRNRMHGDDDVTSPGAFVAYRFDDYLGAELGYRELGLNVFARPGVYNIQVTPISARSTGPIPE